MTARQVPPLHRALSDADPFWFRLPVDPSGGPLLGDGRLGVRLCRGTDDHTLRWVLTYHEARDGAGGGAERIEAGSFDWQMNGTITGVSIRLDLRAASVGGSVSTTEGRVHFSGRVPRGSALLEVRWTALGAAGDRNPRFVPRAPSAAPDKERPGRFLDVPAPVAGGGSGVSTSGQQLEDGSGYATAWRVADFARPEFGVRRELMAAVRYVRPGDGPAEAAASAAEVAAEVVRDGFAAGSRALIHRHEAWWQRYFEAAAGAGARPGPGGGGSLGPAGRWVALYEAACAERLPEFGGAAD